MKYTEINNQLYLVRSTAPRATDKPAPIACQRIQNTSRAFWGVSWGTSWVHLVDLEGMCLIWKVSNRFNVFDLEGIQSILTCKIWCSAVKAKGIESI